MSKKGVSKITGNSAPKTGVTTLYKVAEWYPATPAASRNEALVTWELFKKRADGKFTTTNIKKKGRGEFTFGSKAHLYTYKVEGYLHSPEGVSPMSMVITPQKNDKQPTAEKNILGIKLTYRDGSAVTKTLSYRDQLRATAKCQNLEGKTLVFTLWEDDENGAGHHVKNQKILQSPPILVDRKGYARWDFTLLTTFIALANKREDDKKQHEYYVTAEYNGKMNASGNVNANNPQFKKPPTAVQPKLKPTPNAPKTSTNPASKHNQPDKKGIIRSIKLADKDGNAFTKKPKFGDTISVIIDARNVKGLSYTLRLWEHDNIGDHDLLYNNTHIFKSDLQRALITLTGKMQKIGETGNNPKKPDSGEYLTGNYQEIFAEVIFEKVSAKSAVIDVGIMEEPKKEVSGKSPAIKKGTDIPKNNNTCTCKEKNLVWSDKIGCSERLKVIQVSKNLGVDPNWLMTVIALETAETFDPSTDNQVGYVGLIQFGKDASGDLGVSQSELVAMNFIEQMNYVEKFLQHNKSKYNTLTDLYLGVLYPSASGHGSERDYIILEGKAYQNNPLFFKEKGEWEYATKVNKKGKQIKFKKAVDPNGKTYVWEVAMVAQEIYTKGLGIREEKFTCQNSEQSKNQPTKVGECLETWDTATNNRIEKLHPKIRCAVKNFINQVESEMGIKLRVIQGLRTYAEQNALYAQGRTTAGSIVTKAKGGQSNHNFGLAIDVAEIKNGKIDWSEQEKILPKIAPIGKKWGFSWGGDWKSIIDKPHFEMTFGKSLSELRKAYEDNGKDHTKIPL